MSPSILVSIQVDKDQIQRVYLWTREEGFAYQILGSPSSNLILQIGKFLNHYQLGAPLPPLAWDHTPLFSKKVLQALHTIPFGTTRTYGEIAAQIGQPKAARAVGGACRNNPFPFFLPCHRVVASNSMGGFSGGIDLKKRLLFFENSKRQNSL